MIDAIKNLKLSIIERDTKLIRHMRNVFNSNLDKLFCVKGILIVVLISLEERKSEKAHCWQTYPLLIIILDRRMFWRTKTRRANYNPRFASTITALPRRATISMG